MAFPFGLEVHLSLPFAWWKMQPFPVVSKQTVFVGPF